MKGVSSLLTPCFWKAGPCVSDAGADKYRRGIRGGLPDFGYLREDLPIGDRNDPGRKIKEKMRRTILLFVTLFTAMEIYAQSGSVTATVIDASTREGVPGAVVEFAPADPAAQKRYFTTGYKGRVEATVPYGTYKVSVSFLGYETLERS